IWNEQDQQHQYVIDEQLLQENIQRKKRKGSRFVNKMEWAMIFSNLLAGGSIIGMNMIRHNTHPYVSALGAVMLAAAVYVLIIRQKRLKNENRFDRTMLGDLDHAINNANYRARLSYSMLIYWILFSLLMLGTAILEGWSVMQVTGIAVFCIVVGLLGRWEHKSWHVANKKRLEALKSKLMEAV
ncbi:MAG TPA: hypothetical protein DIS90_06105, partial [Cytophagales bacterium]|nr:hypothetical protein [Cytophagales bacterium]